jgi:hypothetical protein
MKRPTILRFTVPALAIQTVALLVVAALALSISAAGATVLAQVQRAPLNPGPRPVSPVRQAPRAPGSLVPSRSIAPPAPRAAASQPTPESTEPLPPGGVRGKVGQNVSGLSDYDRQMVYINAAKTMRPFGSIAKPWDPATAGPVGPDGWPTGDFGVTMFTEGTLHWNGVYHFSAKGKVERIEAYSCPCRVVAGSIRYDEAAGRTYAEIESVAKPGQSAQMHLRFINTDGGLKDLKLIRPGYTEADDARHVFTNEFLALLRQLNAGVLRAMDWQRINGSTVSKWSERATRDDPTYSDRPGAPLEDFIQLCNTAGADFWLNIPHMADDDYVRQAATLARDTLDPKLFVWVEYSNELWNTAGGFNQSKWNQQQATAEFTAGDTRYDPKNITVRGWQRTGKRTAEIGQIFRQVFAEKGQANRVRVVLCGQSGYPEVVETSAKWISQNVGPLNEHVYAVAVAPYFGSDKYWDKRTDLTVDSYLAPGYTWQVDQRDKSGKTIKGPDNKPLTETRTEPGVFLMDRAEGVMRGPKLARLFELARREKIKACCYEMGLGLGSSDASKEAKMAVNRDPRLLEPTQRYLELWFAGAPDVADVACWFTAASRWHGKGSYGATDDVKDLNVPKVRAIATVSVKHPHDLVANPAPGPDPAPTPEPVPPATNPGKAELLRRAIDEVEVASQKVDSAHAAVRDAQAEFHAKWERLKQTADADAAVEAVAPTSGQ